MDGLATPFIDENESNPVSGDQTSNGQDEVTDANVNQAVVNGLDTFALCVSETNSFKDDSRVETETIVCNLHSAFQEGVEKDKMQLTSRANHE